MPIRAPVRAPAVSHGLAPFVYSQYNTTKKRRNNHRLKQSVVFRCPIRPRACPLTMSSYERGQDIVLGLGESRIVPNISNYPRRNRPLWRHRRIFIFANNSCVSCYSGSVLCTHQGTFSFINFNSPLKRFCLVYGLDFPFNSISLTNTGMRGAAGGASARCGGASARAAKKYT